MVSGFLISPNDQEEMSSGLAMEMRIWSKAGTCTCCLKRLVISFIGSLSPGGVGPLPAKAIGVSSGSDPSPPASRLLRQRTREGSDPVYSAASCGSAGRSGAGAGSSLGAAASELISSTLRPSARISLTSTLKLSGMPASKVSSPRTMAS